MTRIGIMQGRLVPPMNGRIQAFPWDSWEAEFRLAGSAGVNCIEWIYDCGGEALNPLGADEGVARIQALMAQYGVAVRSVCADYFMERPLMRTVDREFAHRLAKLEWLLGQCRKVGIGRVVLPFVDQSAILTPLDEHCVVESLHRVLPVAERLGVELHLETSLSPQAFRALLARVPTAFLSVNYDSGNSAAIGYRPQDEFAAYGERIGSVHIKDRQRGGTTVPLGTGDTDFPAVFSGLKALGYRGDFILQVARGAPGDEVAWARSNRQFVETYWEAGGDGPTADR